MAADESPEEEAAAAAADIGKGGMPIARLSVPEEHVGSETEEEEEESESEESTSEEEESERGAAPKELSAATASSLQVKLTF